MRYFKMDLLAFSAYSDELLASPAVQQMDDFIQHGNTTCLEHCIAVAFVSFLLCRWLHISRNYRSLIRGALLHDLFLYDWHDRSGGHKYHGFTHPGVALINARQHFTLDPIEADIIKKHMWPLTPALPRHREAFVVSMADKFCSVAEVFSGLLRRGIYQKMRTQLEGFQCI